MDDPPQDPKPIFHKSFNTSITSLTSTINNLPSQRGTSQSDAISGILTKISELTLELKDAANYLPAYDQKVYSEQLKGVTEALSAARKAVAPRTKFSFKNRRTGTGPGPSPSQSSDPTATIAPSPSTTPAPPPKPPSTPATSTLTNIISSHTTPPPPTPTTTILSLSGITSSIILPPPTTTTTTTTGEQARTNFTTTSITTVSSSIIILPRIDGPVHLTSLKNSVLVISCRQFRLHDSEGLDVYLSCGSRPIIERCKGVRVSVIPEGLKKLVYGTGGGEEEEEGNKWDQIDDFNWLKEGRPSPNWRVLREEERITEGGWGEVVKEGSGIGDEGVNRLLP
ncbi:hypothetical protein TWF718_002316 [Orbilia javanica]|uniref:C-CAP/cofactor C-like domain-containing protein n=1 Tax=Orbilia javanica TaxID=47235 RepID=A0AAN8MFU2_9PEZI